VRVQEVLSQAVETVGRLPLCELVESVWLALGGPAAVPEQNRREDVATFLDLVGTLEEGGVIRDFSVMSERLEVLFARPSVEQSNVDVMTIYKAKGLEFDIVIVPQAARGTRSSDHDLLVWTEETAEDGTTLMKIAAQPQKSDMSAAYKEISDEIKKKDDEENKRLFYVACTRAKNELHLMASVKRKKDGGITKAGSHTFMGLIWSSVQGLFESELRRRVPVQRSLLDDQADSGGTFLGRLPENWHLPIFDLSVAWQPQLQRAPAAAREITFEWAGDTRRHAGTVIHELLRRIADDGLEAWSEARLANARPVIRAELLRLGVPAIEEPQATGQVARAIFNTLGSKRGQWLLKGHAEARSEYPVGGTVQERLVAGTVDRVFRDEDGRFWIVDFKNSDHKGSGREAFLDEEKRRYTPQLENYATLLRRVTSGPIMLGLYFPLLDAWREWSFEAEAAAAN